MHKQFIDSRKYKKFKERINLMDKQEIFKNLKKGLQNNTDFEAYLSQPIEFDDRHWTAGQFLYKFFMDEWQPFAYSVRDNFDNLTGRERELGEIIYTIMNKRLDIPKNAYHFIKNNEMLDVFNGNGKKESYYQINHQSSVSIKWPPERLVHGKGQS
mgnify:CR=1 FL=1